MAKSKLPQENRIELSKKFLEYVKQITIEPQNIDKSSPMQNEIAELQKLIEEGADSKYKDDSPGEKGSIALHYAARSGAQALVNFLANKDNVNAENVRMVTPLHEAASNFEKEVSQTLIANRADVNSVNRRGETPLHLVLLLANAYQADAEILCKLLMDNKADPLRPNQNDDTPVDYLLNNTQGIEDENLQQIAQDLLLSPQNKEIVKIAIDRFITPASPESSTSEDKNNILKLIDYLAQGLVKQGEKFLIDEDRLNKISERVNKNDNNQKAILDRLKQLSNIDQSISSVQELSETDPCISDDSSDQQLVLSGQESNAIDSYLDVD
jgi:ankyrin repeat protein